MSVSYLVINMDKNEERLAAVAEQFGRLGVEFKRVRGVDGRAMDSDPAAVKLLAPRAALLGQNFTSDAKEAWAYDGTVGASFPHLHRYGHFGTKGLTLSNLLAFATPVQTEWVCVLEDDAEIDRAAFEQIESYARDPANSGNDIVLLDARANGWGGTAGMLYRASALPAVAAHMHPLSDFSVNVTRYPRANLGNLWDWKLWKYVEFVHGRCATMPCIGSGRFKSEIDQ